MFIEEEKALVRTKEEKTVPEKESPEKEKYWAQILVISVANLAGFTEGLHFAWPSPFIVKITQDKENYDISEEQANYFNIITPLAMALSCILFSKLSDKIGRKKTFILIAVPQFLAWLIEAFATNVYHFYAARFFTGAANGCAFSVLPVYMGEISHPKIRGTWGNALPTSMFLGELLINVIGSYCDVKTTAYICMPIPLLFIILFYMMPESPYYYIMAGKNEEAKISLRFLKRKKNVDADYKQLKADVDRQLSESGNWTDLFTIKSNRRALITGIFLRATQQTSGMSVFLVYTQFIFQKSGGNVNHDTAAIIYLSTSLVLNLFALFFIVKRVGRKMCGVLSLASSAVVLYIMATYFYIDSNTSVDLSSFQWVPMASMIAHQVCVSFGISVLPTLMLGELFSTSIKAKAMTILMIQFGVGNIIANNTFYYINVGVGFYAPFYLFAVCCTFSTVIGYYVIPETKGKTLEEIQQLLKK